MSNGKDGNDDDGNGNAKAAPPLHGLHELHGLPGGIDIDALIGPVYPQLCGLCSHLLSVHTPDRCKVCGNAESKRHEGVRADVLACTLLHEQSAMLQQQLQQQAFMAKALVKLIEVMERVAPDPKKPHLVVPR